MSRPGSVIAALALCGAVACGDAAGRSPERAARAFLEAAADGQTEQLFALLAPSSRALLQQLADRATVQAGGQRRLTAQELLVVGFGRPRLELAAVELSYAEGDRAQVRLVSASDRSSDPASERPSAGAARSSSDRASNRAAEGVFERGGGELLDLQRVDGHWRVLLPRRGGPSARD